MTDVGTTIRKPLTPTQRLKMFEAHKGLCVICGGKITGAFIDEHIRPLALGGSNEPSNRGPAHLDCARDKTQADMARITKAKAQKKAALGIKAETQKIASPVPRKVEKPKKNLNPLGAPRPMFRDA